MSGIYMTPETWRVAKPLLQKFAAGELGGGVSDSTGRKVFPASMGLAVLTQALQPGRTASASMLSYENGLQVVDVYTEKAGSFKLKHGDDESETIFQADSSEAFYGKLEPLADLEPHIKAVWFGGHGRWRLGIERNAGQDRALPTCESEEVFISPIPFATAATERVQSISHEAIPAGTQVVVALFPGVGWIVISPKVADVDSEAIEAAKGLCPGGPNARRGDRDVLGTDHLNEYTIAGIGGGSSVSFVEDETWASTESQVLRTCNESPLEQYAIDYELKLYSESSFSGATRQKAEIIVTTAVNDCGRSCPPPNLTVKYQAEFWHGLAVTTFQRVSPPTPSGGVIKFGSVSVTIPTTLCVIPKITTVLTGACAEWEFCEGGFFEPNNGLEFPEEIVIEWDPMYFDPSPYELIGQGTFGNCSPGPCAGFSINPNSLVPVTAITLTHLGCGEYFGTEQLSPFSVPCNNPCSLSPVEYNNPSISCSASLDDNGISWSFTFRPDTVPLSAPTYTPGGSITDSELLDPNGTTRCMPSGRTLIIPPKCN